MNLRRELRLLFFLLLPAFISVWMAVIGFAFMGREALPEAYIGPLAVAGAGLILWAFQFSVRLIWRGINHATAEQDYRWRRTSSL
jgi:hypothetical protein